MNKINNNDLNISRRDCYLKQDATGETWNASKMAFPPMMERGRRFPIIV